MADTLTKELVEEIRALGRGKIFTPSELAKKYEVDIGHIRFILNREINEISKTT